MGLKEQAIHEGEFMVNLVKTKRSRISLSLLRNQSGIYSILGEKEEAIEILEHLLSIPSWIHIEELKINPIWDPLRDHPRFQKMLKGRN